MDERSKNNLTNSKTGLEVIKNYLANLTDLPGVYRMIDSNGEVLYVGKAKN